MVKITYMSLFIIILPHFLGNFGDRIIVPIIQHGIGIFTQVIFMHGIPFLYLDTVITCIILSILITNIIMGIIEEVV